MNDYNCVRNENVKILLSRLKFTCDSYTLKLRLMSSRNKKCVTFSALLVIFFFLRPISWLFPDPVTAYESLLESSKCPACYGSRMCELFYHGQIKMTGASKFRSLGFLNRKNVYHAQLAHGNVVVKKLANNNQLTDIDNKICHDSDKPDGCDVSHAFLQAKWIIPFKKTQLTPKVLKDTNNFSFICPSNRFLDTMWANFEEYELKDNLMVSEKLKVLYVSIVNPEPLILQTFPKSEGWPFPEYFGACGRAVVVENGGEPLGGFYTAEFSVRVALAYELMMIADTLTSKSDYGLYLADFKFDNFVVDYNGKVTLIDLEHVIVVDKLDVKARAPDGWNVPHQTKFTDCEEQDRGCLVFTTADLCNHEISDHNYYAVCRLILSQYSSDPNYPGGLLHSMPQEASDTWDLEYLLNSCANPRPPADRYKVKDKLMQSLKGLNDEFKQREAMFKDMKEER